VRGSTSMAIAVDSGRSAVVAVLGAEAAKLLPRPSLSPRQRDCPSPMSSGCQNGVDAIGENTGRHLGSRRIASSHHQQVEGATETLNGTVFDNLATIGASRFGRTREATIISSSIERPIDSHFGEGHNQRLSEKWGNRRYLFGTVDQLHCRCC